MAAQENTIPAQVSGRTVPTSKNLIQFPAVSSQRCGIEIPSACDPTGQISEVCGSDAYFVCEDCGPICDTCRDSIPCFAPDGQHRPVIERPRLSILRSIALIEGAAQLERLAGGQ